MPQDLAVELHLGAATGGREGAGRVDGKGGKRVERIIGPRRRL
jgi:hypothetical protein